MNHRQKITLLSNSQIFMHFFFKSQLLNFSLKIRQSTLQDLIMQIILQYYQRTIITDLIKYLLEFTRDYFKQSMIKLKEILYPDNTIIIDNNSIAFPVRSERNQKIKQKIKKTNDQLLRQSTKQAIQIKRFTTNQQILNLEENQKLKISYRIMKLKELQQLAISIFYNLKDKNILIKNSIQQWRNITFRIDKKNLMYNFNNLYTKSEIEQMQSKISQQNQQAMGKRYCFKVPQLKKFWRQTVNSQITKQRQVRKNKLKPINQKINYVINLRFDHKSPLQMLLLQQTKNNNYFAQKNLNNLQKLKYRLSNPVDKRKQNNQEVQIKLSPSLFLKKTIGDIMKAEKQQNLNTDEKKILDPQYNQQKFTQKLKNDIIFPNIKKFPYSLPKSEQESQRKNSEKNNSKSSTKVKLDLLEHTKLENKYSFTNLNERNISRLSNISVNLIKLVHFNVR